MTVVATGIGSMPGADATAYAEALRLALGETPDLPFLPELPGRGAPASMTGRALAVVAELGADLQPAGWRLTDAPGVDHRRARSLLAQDLDLLEEQAQGFTGRLKAQVAGPWTLAATVERPKGDRVLADHGARRELAQALAEGLRDHVADLRRRVPGADLLVQVDEPALPTVLAGGVPTASGLHRHRTVHPPEASQALEWVFAAVREAGATPVAHCCAADAPVDLLLGAGAQGVSVDLDVLRVGAYDALAGALEKGHAVMLGVVPATDPVTPPTDDAVTERVLRVLDMLGLDPQTAGDLVVTPSCGLAGAGAAWARRALALSERVARNLSTA
jgi:methionine synthase II (cobalamin-independent)